MAGPGGDSGPDWSEALTSDELKDDTFWPEPRLSPGAARDWFKARIASREPASLVRLGDGEFAMLGYGSIAPWEQTAQSLKVWFGHDDFDPALLQRTVGQLREAVRQATVVGLPRPSRQRVDPFCSYVGKLYAHHALRTPGQLFTDCGIHRFWQMLLAYRELLTGLPFLGIVTSRDIGQQVADAFNVKTVAIYPVPSERQVPGAFEHIGDHFPGRFDSLCAELAVPFRGAVFIVGAGALGKIYANIIHQRGGIALDVGSVLDGWSGTPSRGFLQQDPAMFGLEVYRQTANWTAEQTSENYRTQLRKVFYRLAPNEEELGFYEH